jgi:hypothetical protein
MLPAHRLSRRPLRCAIVAVQLILVLICPLAADDRGIRLSQHTTSKWRFGVVVKAPQGPVTGIRATLPVPMDWPEQTVKKVSEQKTPNVNAVTYSTLDGGVKQMIVTIPRLSAGGEASAVAVFEIIKSRIEPPSETSIYHRPEKPGSELSKFLSKSPYIESTDSKIKSLAGELTADKQQAWDKAAAIYDWVRANVKYEFAEAIKPAIAALKEGRGDCEELSSLVIALCRASKIPARADWVPGHTYAEFYLVDDLGKGHWFPCQAAGAEREFGGMVEDRPILQKGDNYKIPEERSPQRYVKQTLSAKDAAAPPEVKFIMERVQE